MSNGQQVSKNATIHYLSQRRRADSPSQVVRQTGACNYVSTLGEFCNFRFVICCRQRNSSVVYLEEQLVRWLPVDDYWLAAEQQKQKLFYT